MDFRFVTVFLIYASSVLFVVNARCHRRGQLTSDDLPVTVPEFTAERYIGKWYQVYGNRKNWDRYGPFAACFTAEYGIFNETTFTVLNANRVDEPDGDLFYLRGHVYKTDYPRKFVVQFNNSPTSDKYEIIKLGPAVYGQNKYYDYSVVTGSDKKTLFVFARDPAEFEIKYENEVLEFLKGQGFTEFLTEPVPTYHGGDCQYIDADDSRYP